MDEKVDNPALLLIIIKKSRIRTKNAKRQRKTIANIQKTNGVAPESASCEKSVKSNREGTRFKITSDKGVKRVIVVQASP